MARLQFVMMDQSKILTIRIRFAPSADAVLVSSVRKNFSFEGTLLSCMIQATEQRSRNCPSSHQNRQLHAFKDSPARDNSSTYQRLMLWVACGDAVST